MPPASAHERRSEVDVLRHLRHDTIVRNAGAGDDQRDADVGVERGLLAADQPVLAEVVAVVGAEHDVGLVGEVFGGERGFGVGEQLVDRLDGLGPLAVARVDLRELLGSQRVSRPEPRRRVDVVGVERRVAWLFQSGEVVGVTRRGRERRVRRERRDLDRERVRGGPLDECLRVAVQHVDAVVVGAAVEVERSVVVEPVVELGVTRAVRDVPVRPTGLDRERLLFGPSAAPPCASP